MSRLRAALAVTVVALGAAAAQPPRADADPVVTLRGMIQARLAGEAGLRETDGVVIVEATFTRGTITITGRVAREAQREQVKTAVQAIVQKIQNEFDFRVREIDVSKLTVATAPVRPGPGGPPAAAEPIPEPIPMGYGRSPLPPYEPVAPDWTPPLYYACMPCPPGYPVSPMFGGPYPAPYYWPPHGQGHAMWGW